MNSYPNMNSMSDVVALKRFDMETIQRERRALVPITPRLVTWNVNNERPNVYFPNINRSYIADLTYVPGKFINRRSHANSVNREASWSPYTPVKHQPLIEKPGLPEEIEEELEENESSLTNPIQHPHLQINKPLGLLKREYKHPLSMYEEALNNMYSRYAQHKYVIKDHRTGPRDPTLPRQYHNTAPYGVYWYIDRPRNAGKEWVTNRWRMWSGGSASSLE
ncbi:unnamed protein product [Clavelina lepadiformis]|uniref:Uncharacterized protein n=1 Tax=Clavelina lepadiformis TaxID=159417 RepID=A0ABP0FLB3_CLALP